MERGALNLDTLYPDALLSVALKLDLISLWRMLRVNHNVRARLQKMDVFSLWFASRYGSDAWRAMRALCTDAYGEQLNWFWICVAHWTFCDFLVQCQKDEDYSHYWGLPEWSDLNQFYSIMNPFIVMRGLDNYVIDLRFQDFITDEQQKIYHNIISHPAISKLCHEFKEKKMEKEALKTFCSGRTKVNLVRIHCDRADLAHRYHVLVVYSLMQQGLCWETDTYNYYR